MEPNFTIPAADVLRDQGFATWVAVFGIVIVSSVSGMLLRQLMRRENQLSTRIQALEQFQQTTLVELLERSAVTLSESNAVLTRVVTCLETVSHDLQQLAAQTGPPPRRNHKIIGREAARQ